MRVLVLPSTALGRTITVVSSLVVEPAVDARDATYPGDVLIVVAIGRTVIVDDVGHRDGGTLIQ